MKFTIITHAEHKIKKKGIFAYEPYVKEMNLWLKYVDEVHIVAPVTKEEISAIDAKYVLNEKITTSHTSRNDGMKGHDVKKDIKLTQISSFDITSFKNSITAIFRIPKICIKIYRAMQWGEHIHLRCPGNIGLLGCFVQILFPKKSKTAKYAGNWDPNSKQPFSYRLQKWILSNTFLTRNCKVLVYGEWPNQSKNIVPFFTASYSENEIEDVKIGNVSIFKGQITTSLTPRNDDMEGNDDTKRQLQNENTKCHPEPVEGSSDLEFKFREKITTSLTPRNDETERHPQLDWRSHDLETNVSSLRQAQTDNLKPNEKIPHQVRNDDMLNKAQQGTALRHPQPDWGSHGLETNESSLRQAQTDNKKLKFIYVGGFTTGKQPLLSVQVLHELKIKGYQVQLDMYGDGVERLSLENYIDENKLHAEVILHGNTSKEIVKEAYKKAHFLLFISKSEGWPKVVAEAMFWGCLPITSKVSCIPYMLDDGNRGAIVNANVTEIVLVIEDYLQNSDTYTEQVIKAMEWSRTYTLEKFEKELGKLLVSSLEGS